MENLFKVHSTFLIILSFLAFICLFTFLNWNHIKKYKFGRVISFDLTIMTLLLWILLGRIIYIVENLNSFKSYSWHYLPIRSTLEGVKVFDTLPWLVAVFWQNVEFTFVLPISLISSLLFLNSYIVKTKAVKKFLFNNVFITFIYSYIPILLTFGFLNLFSTLKVNLNIGQVISQAEFSIYILETMILFAILIIFKILENKLRKNDLFIRYFFPTTFVIYIIIFRALFFEKNILIWKIDIVQIITVLIYLVYILKTINSFDNRNTEDKTQRVNYKFGLNRDYSKFVNQNIQQNNSYMGSFADYKAKPVKMTFKERLRQFTNKIKRL